MKKVFYVNLDYPPIGGPGIWRVMAFTKYLNESGFDVTVFCSNRSTWHDRVDPSMLANIPSDIKVYRIKSVFLKEMQVFLSKMGDRFSGRFLGKVLLSLRWRLELVLPGQATLWAMKVFFVSLVHSVRNKPDFIITSGPPHDSHLVGFLLTKIIRAKWIMDYRDPWNDYLDSKTNNGKARSLTKYVERVCVKASDAVVTVSPSWEKILSDYFSCQKSSEKFHLLRNGHDIKPEVFDSIERKKQTDRLHLHFNGTIQGVNLPLAFFEALKQIKAGFEGDISLCPYVTFTGFDAIVEQIIKEKALIDIVFDCGALSHLDSLIYSRNADILLVMIDDTSEINQGFIPGKTYEALALGKHVLGIIPDNSDVIEILEEYGNATICAVKKQSEIHDAIQNLLILHSNGSFVDNVSHSNNCGVYSRKQQTKELIRLMESL